MEADSVPAAELDDASYTELLPAHGGDGVERS